MSRSFELGSGRLDVLVPIGGHVIPPYRSQSLHPIGERAAAWCSTLGGDVRAIVADAENLPAALVRAVEFRVAGDGFFAVPLLDDPAVGYVRGRALATIAGGDLEAQSAALERLAVESRNPAVAAVTPELQRSPGWLRSLYDFVMAADGVLVRSVADMLRLRGLVPAATLQRLVVLDGPAQLAVPAAAAGKRDMVVLWAPQFDAPQVGLETFVLAVCGHPAAVACRRGQLNGVGVVFGQATDAPALLARARVVIVADAGDPAPAVTFAEAGYAVVAAQTSGAIEQIDGLYEYDACSAASLRDAVARAWDGAPSRVRAGDDGAAAARYVPAEDARVSTARGLATTAWHLETSYDLRRDAFDRIANTGPRLSPHATIDLDVVNPKIAAGDALAFASWHDVLRVRQQVGAALTRVTVDARPSPDVPAPRPTTGSRDAVVVWAPAFAADDVATILMGLNYEKREIIVVCASGELRGTRARFVRIDAAAAALARAALCVDAETRVPGPAVALAAWGIPLAVASTSGADELLDGVGVYDPWDHTSVFNAAAAAKAWLPPIVPRRIPAAALGDRLAAYESDCATDGPLVSVVLLTRNRRNFLTRAIATVARQRYRNIETIVVRNGGVRVDDIVARVPGARVLDSEVNLGVNEGLNLGSRAARGKYIAYLADDDEYLPDHIGSAVAALERTGSAFAHGGMLAIHLEPDGAGGYDATGYGIACERPAEPGFMRAMNAVATPAMLMRRALLAQTGYWDETLGPMADYELVMRFMLLDELIYVNRPVIVQTYRRDATQYSAKVNPDMPAILRALYARHPIGDEPWVQRSRDHWIGNFARHQAAGSSTPLWYPNPTVSFPPQPYSAAEITDEPVIAG